MGASRWLMSVNPTLGRLEQEDYHKTVLHSHFGAHLGYRVRMELELGGGSQWESAYLGCISPWLGSPAPPPASY